MSDEQQQITDNFAEAFERLSELGDNPSASDTKAAMTPRPEAPTEPTEAPAEPVVEATPEQGAANEEPVAETTPVAEGKEAEETKPAEPAKASDQDIIDRLANAVKDRVQQQPQPQAPQPEPTAQEPQPVLTPDDYKVIDQFEKDWPDVAKAVALREKAMAHEIINYAFQEFAKEFRPVAQTVRALSEKTHISELHNRVNDYDDIRDKVVDWVGQQPRYLQAAYQQVIQHGTVDEVTDLISRYRAATAPAPQAPASPPKPTLTAETRKAAASLAPVSSKRTAVIKVDDPGDYDSAFEIASREG